MRRIIILCLLSMTLQTSFAQCGIENTAFKSGEFVTYDLYFNWKFVWMKVGIATMSTVQSTFNGQDAFRTSLMTRTSSKMDNLFTLRDTLLTYTDMNITPLYFRRDVVHVPQEQLPPEDSYHQQPWQPRLEGG